VWTAIVEGEEQSRVLCRVAAVRAELADLHAGEAASGDWGRALVDLYASQAGLVEPSPRLMQEHVDRAADHLIHSLTPWLYDGGWAGTAWLINHLERGGSLPESDFDEVEVALLSLLTAEGWPHSYDLVSGVVGICVFCRARAESARAISLFRQGVDQLLRLAVPFGDVMLWPTPERLLPKWQRELAPNGYFNLGVAHGVPGVLWVLAKARVLGVNCQHSDDVLERGICWLRKQADNRDGAYPAWVLPDGVARPGGVSWCYGGLGISAVLLSIAMDCQREDWAQAALETARFEARRLQTFSTGSLPVDSGLCHGAAGIAHIFNRLFHYTQDECFLESAQHWFRWVLGFERPDPSIAGFQSWGSRVPGVEAAWSCDPSFLTGAAGTALALLAAATSVEPAWDQVLLMPD
jgi:hypothetical protein